MVVGKKGRRRRGGGRRTSFDEVFQMEWMAPIVMNRHRLYHYHCLMAPVHEAMLWFRAC